MFSLSVVGIMGKMVLRTLSMVRNAAWCCLSFGLRCLVSSSIPCMRGPVFGLGLRVGFRFGVS